MDVSWTVKKAEHRRIDAFELWYWRRLLRVPQTARRSNQVSCTTGEFFTMWATMTNLDSILKSRDVTLATKVRIVKAMVLCSSHVWMWELDYQESWAPKNWCFWTVLLEKTLESPLDCKEIQPVRPKGDQSWIFIGRTDAETETQGPRTQERPRKHLMMRSWRPSSQADHCPSPVSLPIDELTPPISE